MLSVPTITVLTNPCDLGEFDGIAYSCNEYGMVWASGAPHVADQASWAAGRHGSEELCVFSVALITLTASHL